MHSTPRQSVTQIDRSIKSVMTKLAHCESSQSKAALLDDLTDLKLRRTSALATKTFGKMIASLG
jgi:hypothetical protein